MTIEEKISELKLQHPTIRVGSDESGYEELTDSDYDKTIKEWAKIELDKESAITAQAKIEKDAAEAKAAAEAKLAALGLTSDDLKALGLGGN
jgi:hypothetical protein